MRTPQATLAPRRNARLEGRIAFGRATRPCIVRSISDDEARLEVASVVDIPNSFDLVVPGHRTHHCRVVWRALKELGVSYRDS